MPTTLAHPAAAVRTRGHGLRRACGIGAAGAAMLAIVVGWFNPADFFHAYLFAALACLQPALGCLLLTFIHRLTGGAWGRTIAPALAAGRRMVPWTLLFCVPLFFGLKHLFPWAASDALDEHSRALLAKHATYFAPTAFILRAVGYAVVLLVLVRLVRSGRAAPWTGPVGMILYVVTVYLLSVDWVVSLEPGWSSTAFPVTFMASQALAALAFCIAATILAVTPDETEGSSPGVWKDLGNLLLGALMFWAYVAYSQFLIVWSGNLPREAAWYLHRNAGGWHGLLIALAVAQLFLPVLLLLSKFTKRRTRFFAALAGGVVLGQAVYVYWLILPTFRPTGIGLHGLDALLPLALDALWLWIFLGYFTFATKEKNVDV